MIDNNMIEAVIAEMGSCFAGYNECFCNSRDAFLTQLRLYVSETDKCLEAAIIAGLGNNTFDHNFGFNSAYPGGVFFSTNFEQKYTVVADFGKGIRQTLLSVLPSISSDAEALEIAFTRKISGRAPEQRGNGLNFISENIQRNGWHLYFQSGFGSCSIDGEGINFSERAKPISGCLAILDFNGDS